MLEVMKDVFQIDIPLKNSPLRAIHTHLICGTERHLLVDTAFNTAEGEEVLLDELHKIGVKLQDTDIFITHAHVDHAGLISSLKTPTNTVFASAADKKMIDDYQLPEKWEWLRQTSVWAGVPPAEALQAQQHVAYHFRPSHLVPVTVLAPEQKLTYGAYQLTVTDLSGHTPGQIGLWHEPSGSLFCGDHILGKVSPNISAWDLETDYLSLYLQNLQAIRQMPVQNLFAAHGVTVGDVNARIDELSSHHAARLAHTEAVVQEANNPVCAHYVAQRLPWNKNAEYSSLPAQQKWFATSETLAHLQALAATHRLKQTLIEDTCFYAMP